MWPLKIIKGDNVLLRYQLLEGGAPRDITGMDFRLQVREKAGGMVFSKKGFIEEAGEGRFSFLISETERPMRGVLEILMRDRMGEEIRLTPPGGLRMEVVEAEEALHAL